MGGVAILMYISQAQLDNPYYVRLATFAVVGTISAVLWYRTIYLTGDDRYRWILILSISGLWFEIIYNFLGPTFDDDVSRFYGVRMTVIGLYRVLGCWGILVVLRFIGVRKSIELQDEP